jgi:hypothetical protein
MMNTRRSHSISFLHILEEIINQGNQRQRALALRTTHHNRADAINAKRTQMGAIGLRQPVKKPHHL